ncbi:MAG: DUF58 domain-containing protein [Myxococcota bacterium]
MRPTSRLALVILVAAGAAAVAGFWGLDEPVGMLALVTAIPAGIDFVMLRGRPKPNVELPSELRGSLRRELEVPLTLTGVRGRVEVTLDWPHALGGPMHPVRADAGGGVSTVTFRAVPRRRGVHELGDTWMRQESPLGLWARRIVVHAAVRVAVWPDLRGPADDLLGREVEGEGSNVAWGPQQVGSDLRGLRPFQSGDDPRHVDWKATARLGAPIVREWQPDQRRAVVLALDCGRLMRAEYDGESKFDAALRSMARLALAAEARGDGVGVLAFADRVLRYIPPLHGVGQAERLLRYVGDLSPQAVASDLGRAVPQLLSIGRRTLVVVISDVLDGAAAERLVGAVAQLAQRHVPVLALLRDPHLDEAFTRPIRKSHDGYRRAAAELVARERSAALDLLRARGVWAFDLSMRTIAYHVVQSYLDARATGRW